MTRAGVNIGEPMLAAFGEVQMHAASELRCHRFSANLLLRIENYHFKSGTSWDQDVYFRKQSRVCTTLSDITFITLSIPICCALWQSS